MTSLSIIIPTYCRSEQLAILLRQLDGDIPRDSEIIVVSQDRRPIEAIASPLRVLRLRRPSLPAARNAGICASTGAIVLFLDDDSIPMVHLADVHLRLHAQYPHHAAVAGQVVDVNNQGNKPAVVDFDAATLRYRCDFGRMGQEEAAGFHGSHMSFKREVFETLRFDPWFRGNALCEELDLAIRMRRRGMRILFSSQARTNHALAAQGGCRSERTRSTYLLHQFYNRAYCFVKNFGLATIARFAVSQKHDLEYLSRSGQGHSATFIAAGGWGMATGIAAGLLRRYAAPREYR